MGKVSAKEHETDALDKEHGILDQLTWFRPMFRLVDQFLAWARYLLKDDTTDVASVVTRRKADKCLIRSWSATERGDLLDIDGRVQLLDLGGIDRPACKVGIVAECDRLTIPPTTREIKILPFVIAD